MFPPVPILETLDITLTKTGVAELCFNKPKRYNTLSPLAYRNWLAAIQWAAQCDEVKVVVLTGRGTYYTSGKELRAPDLGPSGIESRKQERHIVKTLVDELIDFPKVLIAAVNGHAVGFGVTTLGLCDVVYSVPKANFSTPFMKLSFCAEGCSSVLFPKIMGRSKANEMLLMGRTFTAEELAECGLVSRVLPEEGFHERVLDLAEETARLSTSALRATKGLIRDADREQLLQVNANEMQLLGKRMENKESMESILKFVEQARQRKLSRL